MGESFVEYFLSYSYKKWSLEHFNRWAKEYSIDQPNKIYFDMIFKIQSDHRTLKEISDHITVNNDNNNKSELI